jgi:hypothetical protein
MAGLRSFVVCIVMGAALFSSGRVAGASAGDWVFITTTDYITGNSSVIHPGPPITVDCNVRSLHSDAVARYFEPYIYVVNRKGGDNIQILDPANNYSTVRQFSVGAGSDPHDILVLSPTKAYVTRYNTNVIWIVNPSTGTQTGSIDLSSLADADGLAEIDMMCRVGNRAFVTVQRLNRNNYWVPVGKSYVAVIDAQSDALVDCNPVTPGVQPIEMTGANSYSDIQLDAYTGTLYLSSVGYWGLRDGGIEKIDPVGLQSKGFIFTETAAGGDMTDVEIDEGKRGYAIVSDDDFYTILISFDAVTGAKTGTLYDPNAYVIQDIEVSPWNHLYVADRTPTLPGIRIYDVFTNAQITPTPIDVCLPPFDITFSLPLQTGIADPPAANSMVSLGDAYPNPFHPATTIPFALTKDARVTLGVYDALGRCVRTLLDGATPAGPQALRWDGRDDAGRALASGVYFLRIDADGVRATRKITILR